MNAARITGGKKEEKTHHPIPTLIVPISENIQMYRLRRFVIAGLQRPRKFSHALYRSRLKQIFIVQVVKEYIQSSLCVVDLRLKRGWCTRFDTLHVCRKDFEDWLSVGRNVGAVPGCCFELLFYSYLVLMYKGIVL